MNKYIRFLAGPDGTLWLGLKPYIGGIPIEIQKKGNYGSYSMYILAIRSNGLREACETPRRLIGHLSQRPRASRAAQERGSQLPGKHQ